MRFFIIIFIVLILVCPVSFSDKDPVSYSDRLIDIHWLTINLMNEGSYSPKREQKLITFVVLNRLDHGWWGKKIEDVLFYENQFSWTTKQNYYNFKESSFKKFKNMVLSFLIRWENEKKYMKRVFYYHRNDVNVSWDNHMEIYAKLKYHNFYREI